MSKESGGVCLRRVGERNGYDIKTSVLNPQTIDKTTRKM